MYQNYTIFRKIDFSFARATQRFSTASLEELLYTKQTSKNYVWFRYTRLAFISLFLTQPV